MKLSTLLFLGAALVPTLAQADTVGIHLGTYHDKPGFQSINPGLYYKTDDQWVVGGYYNSMSKMSFYGGYVFEHGPFALVAGGVTGYKYPLVPMLVPSIQYFGVRASFVPAIKGLIDANAIHLSYEFKIKGF